MERIDAHQHFWRIDRSDYGWLTQTQGVLYKDYLPKHLSPILDAYNINRCITVQAAPTIAETEFLLQLCEEHDFIAGVVGWIDLDSDDFESQYSRLRIHPGFIGLRPMIQDLDDDYLLRPRVLRHLGIVVKDSFPIDFQARPRHLRVILKVLEKYPSLRGVLDHGAKPNIADAVMEPWMEDISRIAEFDSITCKLSGLITEAKEQQWGIDDFRPYVHHMIDSFGPERVMFGSDWPVCLGSGTYDDVWSISKNSLNGCLTEQECEWIYGVSAIRFYKL